MSTGNLIVDMFVTEISNYTVSSGLVPRILYLSQDHFNRLLGELSTLNPIVPGGPGRGMSVTGFTLNFTNGTVIIRVSAGAHSPAGHDDLGKMILSDAQMNYIFGTGPITIQVPQGYQIAPQHVPQAPPPNPLAYMPEDVWPKGQAAAVITESKFCECRVPDHKTYTGLSKTISYCGKCNKDIK